MYIVTAKKDAQDVHYPTVLQWTPTQESDADPRIRRESKHMRMSLVHTAPLSRHCQSATTSSPPASQITPMNSRARLEELVGALAPD